MGLFRLLAAILAFVPVALAGQGIVSGRVADETTGEPLQGVYVIWETGRGTLTGADGSFLFSSREGTVAVSFRFVGYQNQSHTVRPVPGDTVFIDVLLKTEMQEIGQIVVSANRSEQSISSLTVSMDVIKAAEFSRSHIVNSQELINKTPGIEVLDGQASIRGGTGFSYGVGSRVMALIDGLPILSADAGNVKWQFIPVESISQVEIIKGASSVLYGSSALNGIINFRTAPAGKDPVTAFHVETGMYDKPSDRDWIWWDTPRIFSSASVSHLRKIGKNELGGGLFFTDNNGYRKYNDEELARANLRFRHNSNREGLFYGLNINAGYTDKTDFVLWENAWTGALKQDTSTVAMLRGSFAALDPYISYNQGGAWKHDLKMRLQYSGNRFPVKIGNNSEAWSSYGEYTSGYSFGKNLSTIGGISWNYSKVLSNFHGDHSGFNVAAFAQAEGTLNRMKLTGGLRLEQNSLDGINDRIVPVFRAGLNWQLAEYTFLRGSFGQGYRYPSVAEKFAATTLGAVRIFPNPGVKAETGWSSEVGIKQGVRAGRFTGQADVALFLSQNKDLIEYIFGYYQDALTGSYGLGFQATNVEQSRISGIETEFVLRGSFGKVNTTFGGGYTFLHPVVFNPSTGKTTGTYLKYRRKHSVKLSLGATAGKAEAGLDAYYRSAILNIDDVFIGELSRERILPGFYDYWLENNNGYFLLDGNIGYRILEGLSLSVSVKNITNTEYMGRPGDIQPQRNFSIRLSGNF